MNRIILTTLALSATLVIPVRAQHDEHHHAGHGSPYADQESSGISSLSQREMDDLLAGAGMGMARPAELNQFPGPKHVLELAEDLELTAEQIAAYDRLRGYQSAPS